MAIVSDICRFLEDLAPLHLAEKWDNVGLLLGRDRETVKRLMTCLTLTLPVADEAIAEHAQMIVTHHPILFHGTKKITDQSIDGQLILRLAEAGIAVYCPHTAFDNAEDGINHQLAEAIGLSQITPLRKTEPSSTNGAGRFGILANPCERGDFLNRVSAAVNSDHLEVSWEGPGTAHRVAIACGAAGEYFADAVKQGCDTFITGETRFHTVLECQANGINLILTGHFPSERPAIETLARKLGKQFPEVLCFPSSADRNPLSLYRRVSS